MKPTYYPDFPFCTNVGIDPIKETRKLKWPRWEDWLVNPLSSSNFKVQSPKFANPSDFLLTLFAFLAQSLEQCPTISFTLTNNQFYLWIQSSPTSSILTWPNLKLFSISLSFHSHFSRGIFMSQIPLPWESAKPWMNGNTHHQQPKKKNEINKFSELTKLIHTIYIL